MSQKRKFVYIKIMAYKRKSILEKYKIQWRNLSEQTVNQTANRKCTVHATSNFHFFLRKTDRYKLQTCKYFDFFEKRFINPITILYLFRMEDA